MVPVPGLQPGMMPTMLLARTTRKTVAMNGKCFFQDSPSRPLHMSSRTNSTRYSTPFTKTPCGTRLADCFFLKTKSATSISTIATVNQNEYCVKPTVSSDPAIG